MKEELKTPQQILQNAREGFEKMLKKKFGDIVLLKDWNYQKCWCKKVECVCEKSLLAFINDWHTSTLQSFIEAERARLEENKHKVSADIVRELENHSTQLRIKDHLHQEYLSLRPDEVRDLITKALQDQISHLKELSLTLKR